MICVSLTIIWGHYIEPEEYIIRRAMANARGENKRDLVHLQTEENNLRVETRLFRVGTHTTSAPSKPGGKRTDHRGVWGLPTTPSILRVCSPSRVIHVPERRLVGAGRTFILPWLGSELYHPPRRQDSSIAGRKDYQRTRITGRWTVKMFARSKQLQPELWVEFSVLFIYKYCRQQSFPSRGGL